MPRRGRRADGNVVTGPHDRRDDRNLAGCGPCGGGDDYWPRLGRDAATPGDRSMTMPWHSVPGVTHPLHQRWWRRGKTEPWKQRSILKKGIADDASHVSSTGHYFPTPRRRGV